MFQEPQEDYFIRKEEERQEKLDRMRLTAGMLEFLGVVAGIAAIFVLVLLIASLIHWLWRDLSGIFSVIITIFKSSFSNVSNCLREYYISF